MGIRGITRRREWEIERVNSSSGATTCNYSELDELIRRSKANVKQHTLDTRGKDSYSKVNDPDMAWDLMGCSLALATSLNKPQWKSAEHFLPKTKTDKLITNERQSQPQNIIQFHGKWQIIPCITNNWIFNFKKSSNFRSTDQHSVSNISYYVDEWFKIVIG